MEVYREDLGYVMLSTSYDSLPVKNWGKISAQELFVHILFIQCSTLGFIISYKPTGEQIIIACESEKGCIIKSKKTCGHGTKVEPTKVKMSKHVSWFSASFSSFT